MRSLMSSELSSEWSLGSIRLLLVCDMMFMETINTVSVICALSIRTTFTLIIFEYTNHGDQHKSIVTL